MKRVRKIGYVLSLGLIGVGAGTSFASCPEKIDPQQLCDLLNQFEDSAWVGCSIGLKVQFDSLVTDPTKDTTSYHNTYSPAPYLVAEVDSLFTNYDIRLPDTIFPNRLVYYPTKSRASIPTVIINNYHAFLRKKDILALGSEGYIGGVWAWFDDGPASLPPVIRKNHKYPYKALYFNLKGQRMDNQSFQSRPIINLNP
jgi:hypothetical protein